MNKIFIILLFLSAITLNTINIIEHNKIIQENDKFKNLDFNTILSSNDKSEMKDYTKFKCSHFLEKSYFTLIASNLFLFIILIIYLRFTYNKINLNLFISCIFCIIIIFVLQFSSTQLILDYVLSINTIETYKSNIYTYSNISNFLVVIYLSYIVFYMIKLK